MLLPIRKNSLILIATFVAVTIYTYINTAQARWFMDDKIDVTIKVQDESKQPIPYVTVWKFVEVKPEHTFHPKLELSMEDLWRITKRYYQTSEFALRYGEKPIPNLLIPVMGNQLGVFKDVINYAQITGEGNHYERPEPTTFGYTFMKRGYLPEKLEFTVSKNKSQAEAIVTLKRDPDVKVEDAPYVQTYDRLRYELSDTRKNTNMTGDNSHRIDRIAEELEQAAQQAIANGDNKAAARIYIRMRYLPEITFIDGKIVGFKQVNLSSERSERAIQRAYELDPENLFVLMFSGKGINHPDGSEKNDRIRLILKYRENMIATYHEAVWPLFYLLCAGAYADLGDTSKAEFFNKEAISFEPKFTDQELKIKQQVNGVTH